MLFGVGWDAEVESSRSVRRTIMMMWNGGCDAASFREACGSAGPSVSRRDSRMSRSEVLRTVGARCALVTSLLGGSFGLALAESPERASRAGPRVQPVATEAAAVPEADP